MSPTATGATPNSATPNSVTPSAAPDAGAGATAPLTRRALREGQDPGRTERPRAGKPRQKKRRGRIIGWIIALVVVFGLLIGGGVAVWVTFEDKIREVLGIANPIDYEGTGTGTEAIVVIEPGDIGSDVAAKLHAADVVMTFQAFYELLLADESITFEPGSYKLQTQMSAAAALAALQDPANKIINQVTIPEGLSANAALELVASGTEIPLDELMAEAGNYAQFGVPAEAPSIEGYLFPATYTFDPGTTAHDAIQKMVDTMFEKLDAAGVAPENRFAVLNMAALVQRESGPDAADMAKIARVFQNRLDRGMLLQSDATVAYGTGNTHTVWTEPEERADASNPYNTYANPGMPIGPIGLPGLDAINSAISPAEGDWLYFVPINLKTGETVFSNTLGEHDKAVAQLQKWCRESDENAAYCA